jgi:hypothetical protein
VNPDGSVFIERLQPIEPKPKRNNLKEIWSPMAPFSLSQLKSELVRIGVLEPNNFLNLSGKDVRGLYRFLEGSWAVEGGLDMVTVYQCFAGSFKLRFKGATSLQRIRDYPNNWADQLALAEYVFASATNASLDNNTLNTNKEI